MKRNLNLPILTLEGESYDDAKTLRDIVYPALRATVPGDERLSRSASDKIFELAIRVVVEGPVLELTVDELKALVDRVVAAVPNPVVRGQACRLLEQDYVEPASVATPLTVVQSVA